MRGVVMYAPGDVRVEERVDPTILEPTDAIIRLTSTCICGSDLWPYGGVEELNGPTPMGDEYVGVVQQVGDRVRRFLPELIKLIWDCTIDPGKVFDLTLPLAAAAAGYRAMDERRATKVLLEL